MRFARRMSQSLDGGSCADRSKPAALDTHGKAESAPPTLTDAQSMLPKAALQDLREDALARYAFLLLLPQLL